MRYALGSLNSSKTLNISAIEVEFLFHISHFPIFDGFFRLEITRTFKYLKVQILSFPLLRNNFFEHFFFPLRFYFFTSDGDHSNCCFDCFLGNHLFSFFIWIAKKENRRMRRFVIGIFSSPNFVYKTK